MRFHEPQFYFLAARAKESPRRAGYLFKKSGKKASPEFPGIRWQKRWCILYYNMIFYYETEQSSKPQGVILLEGSECHKVYSYDRKLYSFVAGMPGDEHRKFMFSTESEDDCNEWMNAVTESSLEKCLLSNNVLSARVKQLEIQLKNEKDKKQKLQREIADQWAEIARLKTELADIKKQNKNNARSVVNSTGSVRDMDDHNIACPSPQLDLLVETYSSKDLELIVKAQSHVRGWLARTRWKRIVEKYLMSSEGDKLRQRNNLIWEFVMSEKDYVKLLSVLVNVFERSFIMSSKSKNPCITQVEVESLFANSEVILVLHQLFLHGLERRLVYWPAIHLEGFLNAMSSMTHIYHEYIRNHPYALQTLAQCKKRPRFMAMLKWHETKEKVKGQTIEQFLYAPVRTIPNYVRFLHDLIEVTPDEIEKEILEEILDKLETVQLGLNAQLSEGESIRHTLEIERLIDGGCSVLLDVNQKFIRHGVLRQFNSEFKMSGMKREKTRHCFLFSRHLIVTSRTTDGCLRLAKVCGKVPLRHTALIEDTEDENIPAESRGLSFALKVQTKMEAFHVTLMAAKATDKAGWTSDITQCIYTLSMEDPEELDALETQNEMSFEDQTGLGKIESDTPVNRGTQGFKTKSLKDDKRLSENSLDIKYGEKVGPYNLPQIQYASVDRLIERLVDPRFPGTEFMDTFLLTYRIFTTAKIVMEAIITYYNKMEQERLDAIKEQKRKEEEEKENKDKENLRRERNPSVLSTSSHSSSMEDLSPKSPSVASVLSTHTFNYAFMSLPDKLKTSEEEKRTTVWFRDDSAIPDSKPRSSSTNCSAEASLASAEAARRRRTSPAVLLGHGKVQSVDYLPAIGQVEYEDGSTTETRVDTELTNADFSRTNSDAENAADISWKLRLERSASDHGRRNPSRAISVERSISDIGSRYGRNRPIPIFGSVNYEDEESLAGSLDSEATTVDSSLGKDTANSFDEFTTDSNIMSRSNTEVVSRSYDERDCTIRRGGKSKMSLELPRNPLLADIDFDPTKRLSLPDASAPAGYQKNLVKWLGIDAPDNQSKTGKKGKAHDDRRSITDWTVDDEMRPREESMSISDRLLGRSPRKSILQTSKSSPLVKNNKKPKPQGSPESPRKKRGLFGSAFKTGKAGMKRSKSDFLRTSAPSLAIREDEEGLPNGRASFVGDDDSVPGTPSDCGSETNRDNDDFRDQIDGSEAGEMERRDSKFRLEEDDGARKGSMVSVQNMALSRAPLKIMNAVKHWISKFPQDFDRNLELLQLLKEFFAELKEKEETLPLVRAIVTSIERLLDTNRQSASFSNPIDEVLTRDLSGVRPKDVTKDKSWNPATVAENLTLLEHHLYSKIPSQEFLKCAWTKKDKETKAPFILKVSKRFNQVTNLIAWGVVHGKTQEERASIIGFWISVAIQCKNLNNFNSVLQIAGGLTNSAVYRMKRSWELVPKELRNQFEELQALVSADKSFRRLREALHQCNPPCVPYLGLYLSDLLFMDEGAQNFDEDNLVNFAKMNRISRCIREIKQYQQLRYTYEHDPDILHYLVATEVDYDEDKLYDDSLAIEPREPVQRVE